MISESEYKESLTKLNDGDEVVVFDRIFKIKRISKLYIFIPYGNGERRFRIKDGYEPGSEGNFNRPRIVPVTDEIRARLKLKYDRDYLKAVFSRTLEYLPQEVVTEMTARLRVYEK